MKKIYLKFIQPNFKFLKMKQVILGHAVGHFALFVDVIESCAKA